MKSKYIVISLGAILLTQCIDIASFKPPQRYFRWNPPYKHYELIDIPRDERLYQWVLRTDNEMRSCGMDPFDGESVRDEPNLCLEKKGWYLKEGPYCENESVWEQPLCIEWRKKHSKPDAKPWSPKKD